LNFSRRPGIGASPIDHPRPLWCPTDFEYYTRFRDLDQRTIAGADEMGVAAVVPHRTIIREVSATVGAKPDHRRTIEPASSGEERLIPLLRAKFWILKASALFQSLVEVDQLYFMTDLRGGIGSVRCREPVITFQDVQRGAAFDGPAHKRPGHKVDPGERRICSLNRQRRGDRLGREGQLVADRDIFFSKTVQ
jgi:hypothetical protein